MKSVVCVLLLATVVMATGPGDKSEKVIYDLDNSAAHFEKYIKDYNKSYKDEADKQEHYKAFVESLKVINRGNSNPTDTATYGLNDFADYTPEQRKFLHGGLRPRQ